ncbi:MAG: tRNA lysidine(34) synthetase TilS [Planctomycetota bacterium]
MPEWSLRWSQLSRTVGIEPSDRLLLALSGGADSVLLLHLLASASPRPDFRAVHVDHNLRGRESRGDADFCENLCRALGVGFTRLAVELDPRAPSLEARAREARYRALLDEALRTGHKTIVTGHHSDDQVETLLIRWIRGTHLPGLAGLRARVEVDPYRAFGGAERATGDPGERSVIVRPLIGMRRAEVRRLLSDRGLTWRDDSHNVDPRFSRTRVRHGLMPTLRRLGGEEAIENLRAFGRAVETLEDQLAGATAHVAWMPAPWAAASRTPDEAHLGGVVPRPLLMRLAPTLRRRVLWRLLVEGTGKAPNQSLLQAVLADLGAARCTRHTLPGGWTLVLRSHELALIPPLPKVEPTVTCRQNTLPFPGSPPDEAPEPESLALPVPGIASLPDGRRVSAERVAAPSGTPVSSAALQVELDADRIPDALTVRRPRSGDRFHPLGAPGSKALRRFLADAGIPREERERTLVVEAGGEIVWVVGVRPSELARVRTSTRERVLLALHHPSLPSAPAGPAGSSGAPEARESAADAVSPRTGPGPR